MIIYAFEENINVLKKYTKPIAFSLSYPGTQALIL